MLVKELFIPKMRITIDNIKKKNYYINLYNGKKDIYESVYNYNDTPCSSSVVIDRIFLDFDYDNDLIFHDDVKKVTKWLKNEGYKFFIRFSGRGFHIFIFTENENLSNSKQCIRNFVSDLHQKTRTKSDMSVVGDIRRVSRVVGTINLKTGLYCIPISYDALHCLSYDEIRKKAKIYKDKEDFINEGSLVSLLFFDTPTHHYVNADYDLSDIKIDTDFPPCIKKLLSKSNLGYDERRELIIYLRDDGYSIKEIDIFLKKILSDEKYYHCTEEENQLVYLYNREDILFSNCNTQKINGICCSNECDDPHLYI